MNNISQEVVKFDMDDNTEKIVDALNLVSEEYLVPVEEIAAALKILNQIKKDSRIQYYPDNKITVTSIKPEWLRREIIETISGGGEVRFSLYHGGRKLSEYPVQLIDSHYK